MYFGICLLSIIPVRKEPAHTAEMVTQVLFGELYKIISEADDWLRIQLSDDGYEGWISAKQAGMITEAEFLRLLNAETAISADLVQILSNQTTKTILPILMGSSLPGLKQQQFQINSDNFLYEGLTIEKQVPEVISTASNLKQFRLRLIDDAMLYLNAPYLWGGRSPFGIDCSGFVQMVYKLKQIKLPRDASQQAAQGEVVGLLGEAEPGDLAFFDDNEGTINHVGILIDQNQLIHCSGKVRIDPIDHQGIYLSLIHI